MCILLPDLSYWHIPLNPTKSLRFPCVYLIKHHAMETYGGVLNFCIMWSRVVTFTPLPPYPPGKNILKDNGEPQQSGEIRAEHVGYRRRGHYTNFICLNPSNRTEAATIGFRKCTRPPLCTGTTQSKSTPTVPSLEAE
jgi:hypothetical protein